MVTKNSFANDFMISATVGRWSSLWFESPLVSGADELPQAVRKKLLDAIKTQAMAVLVIFAIVDAVIAAVCRGGRN